MNSRITQAISDLHALFDDDLKGISFPDLDAEVLLSLQGQVDAAREEVARCEEALDAANRQREAEEESLIKAAIRAQKYARIFASENEELLARIDALELEDKPVKKKVRRSRKAKAAVDHTIPLTLQDPSEETAAQETAA